MLRLKVSTTRLQTCLRVLARELPGQERNAVNKAARAGRTAFIGMLPAELRIRKRSYNVDKGGATTDFSAATAEGLKAVYRPSRQSYNLSFVFGVTWNKTIGVRAKHNVVSGGGSANLVAKHAFFIRGPNGFRVVNRTRWGKGTHRAGYKAMRTTTPAGVMGQTTNPLRVKFETVAAERLAVELPGAINEAIRRSGFND